jgi:hypothetical protein
VALQLLSSRLRGLKKMGSISPLFNWLNKVMESEILYYSGKLYLAAQINTGF